MKKLFAALAVLTLCSSAFAAPAAAPTKQQSKMTTCNADAAGKKGDERKAFMKTCLSAKPAEPVKTATPQQEKMKACSAEGKGKKGADYKAFMKTCLSAPKA
ncbi:MAG: PsiF family protein [Pseudomonadota bacterium]